MTEQESPVTSLSQIQEAQDYVVFFTRLLSELKLQIEAERSNLPPSADVIETDILKLQMSLEKVQTKIDKEKQKCKKRKQEVDEWKSWYSSIAQIDKSEAREKLDLEIKWRSQAISKCEAKISQLQAEELVEMGNLEKKRIQLEAFTNGVYDLPIESDPRLIAAQEALQTAQDALKAAQAQDSINTTV